MHSVAHACQFGNMDIANELLEDPRTILSKEDAKDCCSIVLSNRCCEAKGEFFGNISMKTGYPLKELLSAEEMEKWLFVSRSKSANK
mmetsp:Transcript_11347/g.14032  ORF Transcript_11347/g.14032 Transcript_11347/m.14032 type:complete len:87 (+) Transcript_11347:118-378(+)